jgi:hypothetical protein
MNHRTAVGALAALALAACSGDQVTNPRDRASVGHPSFQLFPAQRRQPRAIRDEYRDLARRHPEFTGVYLDDAGKLVVVTTSDRPSPATLSDVVSWASDYTGVVSRTATPLVKRAQFSYGQLDSVFTRTYWVRP